MFFRDRTIEKPKVTLSLWLNREPDNVDIKSDITYIWQGGGNGNHFKSVLDYVENNSSIIRAKYLSFIHQLGEHRLRGKCIIEHLQESRGYNIWWMSSISGKSYIGSPRLNDCIRLLALEDILIRESPSTVIVYGMDRDLLAGIKALCIEMNIRVLLKPSGIDDNKSKIWKLIRRLRPEILVAVLWLYRYLNNHWKLRNKNKIDWFKGDDALTFFSLLFYIDENKNSNGEFYSGCWSVLPELLTRHGIKINWLHRFVTGPVVKDAQAGLDSIQSYNKNPVKQGNHAFFESHLGYSVVISACCNYIRFLIKTLFLWNVSTAFRPINSSVSLWPLLRREWRASVRGSVAMQNLIFIELIDVALKTIGKQKLGFYMQENQNWEKALVHAWNLYGHGILVGVPHSTVNFWDLRLVDDVRTIDPRNKHSRKLPQFVAVNGKAARQQFINGGYPKSKLIDVEALRYLGFVEKQNNSNYHQETAIKLSSMLEGDITRVIILGDIMRDLTQRVLQFVRLIALHYPKMQFTFKSHLATQINIDDFDIPRLEITTLPLFEILNQYDLAIVAGSSSSAIDVYYSGIELIVCLGVNELNLSPVRGFNGVKFVRTFTEMQLAFTLLKHAKQQIQIKDKEYFWLDKTLPRWRKLIASSGYSQLNTLT